MRRKASLGQFFEFVFQNFRKVVSFVGLAGLVVFLIYCFQNAGRPPSGMTIAQLLDLSLIALASGLNLMLFNLFLMASAVSVLKPSFSLVSRVVKSEPKKMRMVGLFESKGGPYSGWSESFEAFFHSSISWPLYLFFLMFGLLFQVALVASGLSFQSFVVIWLSALVIGFFAGLFYIFSNRATRILATIGVVQKEPIQTWTEKLRNSLWEANAYRVVFFLVASFFPVFSVGIGPVLLTQALEVVGYRASSATVYVDSQYCALISDRYDQVYGAKLSEPEFVETVENGCVLRRVEVLLYRIGDEVSISLPKPDSTNKDIEDLPLFLPAQAVNVQSDPEWAFGGL